MRTTATGCRAYPGRRSGVFVSPDTGLNVGVQRRGEAAHRPRPRQRPTPGVSRCLLRSASARTRPGRHGERQAARAGHAAAVLAFTMSTVRKEAPCPIRCPARRAAVRADRAASFPRTARWIAAPPPTRRSRP